MKKRLRLLFIHLALSLSSATAEIKQAESFDTLKDKAQITQSANEDMPESSTNEQETEESAEKESNTLAMHPDDRHMKLKIEK
jgi:hypothetical protein